MAPLGQGMDAGALQAQIQQQLQQINMMRQNLMQYGQRQFPMMMQPNQGMFPMGRPQPYNQQERRRSSNGQEKNNFTDRSNLTGMTGYSQFDASILPTNTQFG